MAERIRPNLHRRAVLGRHAAPYGSPRANDARSDCRREDGTAMAWRSIAKTLQSAKVDRRRSTTGRRRSCGLICAVLGSIGANAKPRLDSTGVRFRLRLYRLLAGGRTLLEPVGRGRHYVLDRCRALRRDRADVHAALGQPLHPPRPLLQILRPNRLNRSHYLIT